MGATWSAEIPVFWCRYSLGIDRYWGFCSLNHLGSSWEDALHLCTDALAMLQLWWRWMMPPCSERWKNRGGLGGGSMALIWQINGSFGRWVVKFQVRITYHKDTPARRPDNGNPLRYSNPIAKLHNWGNNQLSHNAHYSVQGKGKHTTWRAVHRCSFWICVPEIMNLCGMEPNFWADLDPWQDEHHHLGLDSTRRTKELKQLGVSHFTAQCSFSQWTNLSLVNSYPIFPGPMDPMFGETSMVDAHPTFWVQLPIFVGQKQDFFFGWTPPRSHPSPSPSRSAVPRAWCVPPAGCAATTALCARGSRGAAGGGRLETQKWWENRWEKLMVSCKWWENPWENLWFDVVYDSWWFPADSQPSHWEKRCFEPWGSFGKSNETIRMTGHFEQEKWGNFAIQTEHIQIFVGLKPS